LNALVSQFQRQILIEQPMPGHLTFEFRLLILHDLPLNQVLFADRTDGERRRPGKTAPTMSAESSRANLAFD
jgi:hypothetical protein